MLPYKNKGVLISIHALRVEGDMAIDQIINGIIISIHALRVEGDCRSVLSAAGGHISIHALRVEGDRFPVLKNTHSDQFLSTPSVWRATTSPAQG